MVAQHLHDQTNQVSVPDGLQQLEVEPAKPDSVVCSREVEEHNAGLISSLESTS